MRGVRNTEHGIEVLDVTDPGSAGVTVRVGSASICGSDLHMVELGPLPFTLGHELAGTLVDGQRVAVVGAGGIGLAAVAVVAASGNDVALVARHPAQREAGEKLGARPAPGGEHDLVVEAAGTQSALATAAELCAPRGTILF